MFDPVTARLIATAPPLDGLDLEDLPKQFTRAFADIVAARVRLRESPEQGFGDELIATLDLMRRIAAAHEAQVALLPERENRGAAAFVAATAHQTFASARVLADEKSTSYIESSSVSPDVCATLLFMVAESYADAAEAAKAIAPDADRSSAIERALLQGLVHLARGELRAIQALDVPVFDTTGSVDEQALDALLGELFTGVRNLASQLLLRVDVEGGVEPGRLAFERVRRLSVDRLDDTVEKQAVYSLFAGPLHLANLLLSVERDLIGSALTRLPTPSGVDDNGWWQIIRRMARQRPYLWKNHRDAIEQGYLAKGTSAAVSFPTGGGKSTLAELKIATALLRGEQVVFLAPTNALVDQTANALKNTFQGYTIIGDTDDDVIFENVVILPEVIVTTPERCLLLHSIQPEAFANLGLIVFDECHLLHPKESDRSRRAVDSMLTLLNLTATALDADVLLLSAMMKNAAEVADWIHEISGRPCIALDLGWKPTRQVRGTVVYPAQRVAELRALLAEARRDYPTKKNGAPAHVERQLTARPFGLFCLLQTWASTAQSDYALLPLIEKAPHLTTALRRGGHWGLTPNGNKLSAAIAAASAANRIKTLVFVQSTVLAKSAADDFASEMLPRSVELNDPERKLHELVAEEMGGAQYCYLQLDENGIFHGGATSHHALLLREERHLHESLFKRPDGIDVLFATSTLAQGMNLPSEIVIIAGDSRFDEGAEKMKVLEAYELLNAAGRAGRAGERSQGFVLIIPSRVIDFNEATGTIDKHWATLRNIFEQADQCLIIDDPFVGLLDQIHNGAINHGMPAYLLSKLPVSPGEDPELAARGLLERSFGAFRARQEGRQEWIDSRLQAALAARKSLDEEDHANWLDLVSGSTGVPVPVLRDMLRLVDDGALTGTAEQAIDALIGWIEQSPERLLDLVRPENIEGLFGQPYKNLKTDSERGAYALPSLKLLLHLWMGGQPLSDIEKAYLGKQEVGLCKHARHFSLRLVPDLAFVAGLPARILAAQWKAQHVEEDVVMGTVVATLQAIIREGCDSPESLATRMNLGRSVSRVGARRHFEAIRQYAPPGSATEPFEATKERMRTADIAFRFAEG